MKRKFNFNKNDFEFMQSTSSAILEESPKKLRIVLQFWIGTVLFALIWAGFAPIDEIVRGDGKVIPGGENQMIQHLEGGIIESILVKEGQKVNIDDVLMKIQNQKSSSTFESSQYKVAELRARIIRLKAEASGGVFSPSADDIKKFPLQIAQERNLYNTNRERLSSEISSLNDQYAQKKNEIIEVKGRMDQQKKSLQLTKEEVSITEPLVAQGIKPKVEFLRLQRSLAEVTAQYNSSADSLPRLNSAISEMGNK